MARVKPNLFSAISGRVGGVEFAMAKEGIVAKRRKPPREMNSPREINARTDFARVVYYWHTMTAEEMLAWEAWAHTHPVKNRLGKTIYLSAYNWFLKLRKLDGKGDLPVEVTLPVELGTIMCWDSGPYVIPVLWPAAYPDDATVSFRLEEHNPAGQPNYIHVTIDAGTYAKLLCPTDFYALWQSLDIHLYAYHTYWLLWRTTWPGLWRSFELVSQFTVYPGSPEGLWLMMDDCNPSPQVRDASYTNNQTFEGASPNTVDHSVPGIHYRALHFDGVGDKIVLTPAVYQTALEGFQDFTVCLWWKPDVPVGAAQKCIVGGTLVTRAGFRIEISDSISSMSLFFLYGGSLHYVYDFWPEADLSIWQHWAIVRSSKNLRTFRNGILHLDSTDDHNQGRLYDATLDLSIGCNRGSADFAKGAADDFHIYDRALSDSEIAALAVPQ